MNLSEVLASRYGVDATDIHRLPRGSETDNYRAALASGGHAFVKAYRPGTDFESAQTSVRLSEFARQGGIPTPRVWTDRDGGLIARTGSTAVSVWEWIDADAPEPFSPARAEQVGAVLGRLHRRLAEHPSRAWPQAATHWWAGAPGPAIDAVDQLLTLIDARDHLDDHGQADRVRLRQRRSDLARMPELQRGLPAAPARQLTHFDYTRPNVCFRDDHLVAVLDFRGRVAMPAWELGRVAFDALTIATRDDWLKSSTALVSAYRDTNPLLPAPDIAACARMALLHSLYSLFGVWERYTGTADPAVQADLDSYWINRHTAVRTMLDQFDEINANLTAIARG